MNAFSSRRFAIPVLVVFAAWACAGCETTSGVVDEGEPVVMAEEPLVPPAETAAKAATGEGEVPLVVAATEESASASTNGEIDEVIVEAARGRDEVILDLVAQAKARLGTVELEYVFIKIRKKEVLRGRPVVFALWSESQKEWSMAHLEIPRPPVKWKPGGKPLPFIVRTPGIQVRHVKGTGAERLMFAFTRNGEQLKVYGRKFPVFDSALIAKKRWRAVVDTAQPIVYLPFNEDTLDPLFVKGGREFLLATAHKAIAELRRAYAPSVAFRGELLADVVPAALITTLAVIEQTDDGDFIAKRQGAFEEVLSQYGLKREEAYRYSVSSAAALGAMQFTNRRGNGTYSMVVRRCPAASIDPSFERGATNLLNAMKAAICLFDIELSQMPAHIRAAYRANPEVLGIFPVAAYNGGPRNVKKLNRVITGMGVTLGDLRRPAEQPIGRPVTCPCVWVQDATGVRPLPIPRYNNENRWYIEKYQSILQMFE